MKAKGVKKHEPKREGSESGPSPTDEFDNEFPSEFAGFPKQLIANIGPVIERALLGGGYFGISISDDRGSCKLVVRHGPFEFDRRLPTINHLEQALAFCFRKLA